MSQFSEGMHRITMVFMSSQLRKQHATLSLAFCKLDRHRISESFKQRIRELNLATDQMRQDLSLSLKLASSAELTSHPSGCDACERRKQRLAQLLVSISDTTFDLQLRLQSLRSSEVSGEIQDARGEIQDAQEDGERE